MKDKVKDHNTDVYTLHLACFAALSEILVAPLEIFLNLSGQMKSKAEYLFTRHRNRNPRTDSNGF